MEDDDLDLDSYVSDLVVWCCQKIVACGASVLLSLRFYCYKSGGEKLMHGLPIHELHMVPTEDSQGIYVLEMMHHLH